MEKRENRFQILDCLRGLAALSVLFYHYTVRYHTLYIDHIVDIKGMGSDYFPVTYIGQIPVYLFFIISGFVIFLTVTRSRDIRDFMNRRFSRLYPCYWTAMIATTLALLLWSDSGRDIDLAMFLVNLTMFQDYFRVPPIDGVYWSLAVELSFYILTMTLMRFRLRERIETYLLVWSLLVLGYALLGVPNPIPYPVVYLLVLDHGHFFASGIVFYRLWTNGTLSNYDRAVMAIAVVAIAIKYPVGVAAAVYAVYFVFYAAVRGWLSILVHPVLVWFGTISYALYLVHQEIGYAIMQHLPVIYPLRVLLAAAAVIALAAMITFLVERPAQYYLRRKFNKRAAR